MHRPLVICCPLLPLAELTLSRERTDTLGFQGHLSADQVLAGMWRPWSEAFSGSAGLGFARMGADTVDRIGYLQTDASLPVGRITLKVSHNALSDFGETIRQEHHFERLGRLVRRGR